MKKYRKAFNAIILILLVNIVLLLNSCHDEIPMPYGSTYTRLAVDGSITTDTFRHYVRLTKSGDALNYNPIAPISNAIVTISDGDTVFELKENSQVKGLYETDPTVYGIPGRTYKLNINADLNDDDSLELYTATSILKNENPIDSIKIIYQVINPHFKGWLVNMYAKDIGGKNFYLIKIYKNGILLTDSVYEYSNITDNTGFEGKYFYGFPVYFLNENKTDEILQKGDTVTVEMDGITKEYFQFIYDYLLEYYPKMPIFSSPSANISTNVQPWDMTIGFFSAYSVTRKSVIY